MLIKYIKQGVLQNGKMIAVKKVESMLGSKEQCERAKKQFENEVNLLMRLKHPNIVQLLGHCYETHHIRWLHDGKYIICWQIDSLLCLEFLPESLNGRISGM
jgi:serine/threonine protein kinase